MALFVEIVFIMLFVGLSDHDTKVRKLYLYSVPVQIPV